MVKIIMHGCNGHMGQVITGLVKEDANAEIIAGIDMNDNGQNDYPVFKSLAECDVPADVVVDFSSYKAADALLDVCKCKRIFQNNVSFLRQVSFECLRSARLIE